MKQPRILFLVLTALLVVSAFFPYAAYSQEGGPQNAEATPAALLRKLFLPLSMQGAGPRTITGRVVDASGQPLAGVDLVDSSGATAVTGADGRYTLAGLPSGRHALAPAAGEGRFSPSMVELNLGATGAQADFAAAACTEAAVNGGFETGTLAATDDGWEFPITEWRANYSTGAAHSGARSALTGILNTSQNTFSYSSTRQTFILPANATAATLKLWLYPVSGEAAMQANADGLSVAEMSASQQIAGPEVDAQALTYDAQFVLVLDNDGDLLETLLWIRSNSQTWNLHQFNLQKYAGKKIQIEVGSYNDGISGVTGLYVDDVSLELCTGGTAPTPTPTPIPTTPPAGACTPGLANTSFETNTGWNIEPTVYTARYSSELALTGARSLLAGITRTAQNKFSHSVADQFVTIPANATSATVTMHYYPFSEDAAASAAQAADSRAESLQADALQAQAEAIVGMNIDEVQFAGDIQYLLVLNKWDTILETLLWTQSDAQAWQTASYDLLDYAGQTIQIHFGVFNNGAGGVSSMYVDDLTVDLCTGGAGATPTPIPTTPTPTTTPPPAACTEKLLNNGFEAGTAWDIPLTAYSAGYSGEVVHAGTRAMRTGIPFTAHNRFSYSDAGQQVVLPKNLTSAALTLFAFAESEDPTAASSAAGSLAVDEAAVGRDVQYVLVLDQFGNWIDTLLWQRSNAQTWGQQTFDLKKYAGQTIRVQFGTYNDGAFGVSALYVDDASLQVCQ